MIKFEGELKLELTCGSLAAAPRHTEDTLWRSHRQLLFVESEGTGALVIQVSDMGWSRRKELRKQLF